MCVKIHRIRLVLSLGQALAGSNSMFAVFPETIHQILLGGECLWFSHGLQDDTEMSDSSTDGLFMQALLVAKWPVQLQYHPKSCIRLASQLHPHDPPAGAPRLSQDHKQASRKGLSSVTSVQQH